MVVSVGYRGKGGQESVPAQLFNGKVGCFCEVFVNNLQCGLKRELVSFRIFDHPRNRICHPGFS
jgi:hypothetical protein